MKTIHIDGRVYSSMDDWVTIYKQPRPHGRRVLVTDKSEADHVRVLVATEAETAKLSP